MPWSIFMDYTNSVNTFFTYSIFSLGIRLSSAYNSMYIVHSTNINTWNCNWQRSNNFLYIVQIYNIHTYIHTYKDGRIIFFPLMLYNIIHYNLHGSDLNPPEKIQNNKILPIGRQILFSQSVNDFCCCWDIGVFLFRCYINLFFFSESITISEINTQITSTYDLSLYYTYIVHSSTFFSLWFKSFCNIR